jgi:hypothetical protein
LRCDSTKSKFTIKAISGKNTLLERKKKRNTILFGKRHYERGDRQEDRQREKEKERQRDRQRETERDRERQREKRETEGGRGRQRQTETDRKRERDRERKSFGMFAHKSTSGRKEAPQEKISSFSWNSDLDFHICLQ